MINSIAWKNIWRNKLRSLVVIFAVTFGILAGVFSAALMNGMVERRLRTAIEIETSNVQLHNPKYLENKDIIYTVNNADSILQALRKMTEVKSAAKRMKITAMANTSTTGTGVIVFGVQPDEEKLVSSLYKKIPDSLGTYFETTRINPIVLSERLAEKLKLRVKSKIVLTFQSTDGTLVNAAFKVTGIFKTNNSMFDEMNAFVRFSELASLTNFDNRNAH